MTQGLLEQREGGKCMKPTKRKKLAIALGSLILLVLLAVLLVPKLLDPDRWHQRIVSELEKALGGKVSIGDISWGILKGLWLEVDGFEITGASAFPMDVKLSRLDADVAILPLLEKRIILKDLRLGSPDVRLRLRPRSRETAQEQKPLPAGANPAGVALPIEIEQLIVTNGKVRVEDSLTLPARPIVRQFGDIEIKAKNLAPGREMLFEVSMKDEAAAGLGALKAQGSFTGLTKSLTLQNPKLTVHATLSAIHTEALKLYLGNAPWVQRLSGSLSTAVNYEGDLVSHHHAQGSIDISRIAFSDPSTWEAVLPGVETKIIYEADLQAGDLTVENLEVRLGKLSFRARGEMVGLKNRPVIRNAVFSAELPLLDSIPLFPWKILGDGAAFVRSVFEGGGKVEIEQAVLPPIDLAEPPALDTLLLGIESTSRITGVSIELSPGMPRIKNVNASVRLLGDTAQVQVQGAQFTTVDLPGISGKVTKLFAEPVIDAAVNGPLRVNKDSPENLAAFFRRSGLEEVRGSADLDTRVLLDTSHPANLQVDGKIALRDVYAKASLSPARLEGLHADLVLTPEVAHIQGLSTRISVPTLASSHGGRFELRLGARVDEWSHKPAVTLQRLETSSVPLPVVASLVPWEKLGESAEPVKRILLNGGTMAIENLALPKVALADLPRRPAQLLPRVRAAAGFAGLEVQPYAELPPFEDIRGRISLEAGVLTATGVQGRVGPLSLPDLNIRASRLDGRPKVAVWARGPLHLAATSDERVEDLLKKYGLKSLVVSANMDMRADLDESLQQGWIVDGSLVLGGVKAETYPAGVVVENLQGRVTVNRRKGANITAENVRGRVDRAPVRLSGKILGVGTPNLVVDVKAGAKQLDLAHFRELFPDLKKVGLAGTVDMDLEIHIPYAAPRQSRLNGILTTQNLYLHLAHVNVERGDVDLNLAGNTAFINKAQGVVNGTLVSVTGRIANPVEPNLTVLVTSPDLDLDRLLPPGRGQEPGAKPSQEEAGHGPEKTVKHGWPPTVLKTKAHVQVDAEKGQYRRMAFQNLKLDARYDRGVIKQGDLSFGMDGGQVAMAGSGDIRDREHVTFAVSPKMTSVKLESLAALLGVSEVSVSGPLSLNGRLQGKTGSSGEPLASLDGHLNAKIGPGKLARIGRGGDFLARMLSLISIRGILTGSVFDNFASKGLAYQTITAQATFQNGNMDLTNFLFESNAMNLGAQGRVDLIKKQMDINASLKPLGAVSRVIGIVPLVGKVAAGLTEIHFNLSGSLDNPRVLIIPGQGIANSIQNQAKGMGSIFRGFSDFFGRDEEKSLKK
jgi:hypothetical protein